MALGVVIVGLAALEALPAQGTLATEEPFAALEALLHQRAFAAEGVAFDVFGEIGLLTGVPRTATVRAETDGRLFELDGQDFLELVAAGPGLASRLLDIHGGSRVAVVR